MQIFIASDHAGFALKQHLVSFVQSLGHEVVDCGPEAYDEKDDYPDFVSKVAQRVSNNPKESRGIVLGGSGQGEAMVANRFSHVRALVYYGGNEEIVLVGREHNDANVLSLGARFITEKEAERATEVFLDTPFSGDERHIRRIKKIETTD